MIYRNLPQPDNELIKTKCVKYKAFIVITGAIQETFKVSLYQEQLGLESLRDSCKF